MIFSLFLVETLCNAETLYAISVKLRFNGVNNIEVMRNHRTKTLTKNKSRCYGEKR